MKIVDYDWFKNQKLSKKSKKRKKKKELNKLINPKSKRLKSSKKLQEFAKEVESIQYPSEVWFRKLYKKRKGDRYNEPEGKYLPDLINREFKYIVEIDGSIHNLPRIQAKDRIKEEYYKVHGYVIFRIKAYDMESYKRFENDLDKYLNDRKRAQTHKTMSYLPLPCEGWFKEHFHTQTDIIKFHKPIFQFPLGSFRIHVISNIQKWAIEISNESCPEKQDHLIRNGYRFFQVKELDTASLLEVFKQIKTISKV